MLRYVGDQTGIQVEKCMLNAAVQKVPSQPTEDRSHIESTVQSPIHCAKTWIAAIQVYCTAAV